MVEPWTQLSEADPQGIRPLMIKYLNNSKEALVFLI